MRTITVFLAMLALTVGGAAAADRAYTLAFGGETRVVRVCEAELVSAEPNVVIGLHGGGGHPWTPFNNALCERAIETGGVAVVPYASAADGRFWNICTTGGAVCADPLGNATSQTADDALLVKVLADWSRARWNAGRVVVAGNSRGAMLALHAGGNYGETFDLVLALSGTLTSETYVGARVETVLVNAIYDWLVPLGGRVNGPWPSVWASAWIVSLVNGCDGGQPPLVKQGQFWVRAFEGCAHPTELRVHAGEHGWAGASPAVRAWLLARLFGG